MNKTKVAYYFVKDIYKTRYEQNKGCLIFCKGDINKTKVA